MPLGAASCRCKHKHCAFPVAGATNVVRNMRGRMLREQSLKGLQTLALCNALSNIEMDDQITTNETRLKGSIEEVTIKKELPVKGALEKSLS